MLRSLILWAVGIFLLASSTVNADDIKLDLAAPSQCTEPAIDPTILPIEQTQWSTCEKWVWSCVRQGLEANLFEKTCFAPRQDAAKSARAKYKLAPFVDPDQYKTSNAISDRFLTTILTNAEYTKHVPPIGVRIFGAYFGNTANLENVTTGINLVLDGTIARNGLRMTNFRSAKNLSIDGSNIRGTVFLMRARIDGSLFLERAVLDNLDLNDARIGASLEATGALFNGEFRLMRATVDGKVILTKARLTNFIAWNARIGSSLELRLADVRVGLDLTGTTVDGDVRMQDVSFGRKNVGGNYCDWDPTVQTDHVLSMLRQLLPQDKFDAAWQEVVIARDYTNGAPAKNVCADPALITQPSVIDNVLLRDMKIKGTLCIFDVSGERLAVPGVKPWKETRNETLNAPERENNKPQPLATISLDGTEAKTTLLSWPASQSPTMWRATNYKTEYLQINLNNQPDQHYVDNLDLRLITFLRQDPRIAPLPQSGPPRSDEQLVKEKCDIAPGTKTTDDASNRDTQERIIKFFKNDRSESAQPFSDVVAALNSSGVNTIHLRKALSELKFKNACTSSEFIKIYRELRWGSIGDAWSAAMNRRKPEASKSEFMLRELRSIGLDCGCLTWLFLFRNTVSYGHEPLRLGGWIAAAIFIFWLVLKLDAQPAGIIGHRPSFGLVYAVDNLIPLKQYRIRPELSEEKPNRALLRGWLYVHRMLGLFFAVMAFFYIYKASV